MYSMELKKEFPVCVRLNEPKGTEALEVNRTGSILWTY